ncbi:MAG: helical backbone metal receptor [Bacteroidota bacterium]|nr:helical backbone metal receptor [Bacteroidota bacterium]
MHSYTDQIQQEVRLQMMPKRIVSLVPSQTEFLAAIGLDEEVVGITKFCVHPTHWFRNKQRVGGTKQVHLETVRALQPDLIIANKEENVREQVQTLADIAPVWTSDINTVNDALHMMEAIGNLTGKQAEAATIIKTITDKRIVLQQQSAGKTRPLRVAYLIWKDPYMTVGGDSFIDAMLRECGWQNVYADKKRYPQISIADLQAAAPDRLFLSSEPYPFKQQHIDELQPFLPDTVIQLVDGEMFSWYGSRMIPAFDYFLEMQQQLT